jgi:phage/plasmid-associated DNA primase
VLNEYTDNRLLALIQHEIGIEYSKDHPQNKTYGYTNEQVHLKKVISLYNKKDDCLKIKINDLPHGWGRIFPTAYASLSVLHRKTRHSLCEGIYADIDIVSSCQSVFKNILEMNGYSCPYLTEYIERREEIFLELQAKYKVERDILKKLFTSLAFGGQAKYWYEKFNVEDDLNFFICRLEDEYKLIIEIIYDANQQIIQDILKAQPLKFIKHTNPAELLAKKRRTVAAMFYQTVERQLQEAMIKYLVDGRNFKLEDIVPCQDGFMVLKPLYYPEILQECEQVVKNLFDFNIKLKMKEFDERFEIPAYISDKDKKKQLKDQQDANKLILKDQQDANKLILKEQQRISKEMRKDNIKSMQELKAELAIETKQKKEELKIEKIDADENQYKDELKKTFCDGGKHQLPSGKIIDYCDGLFEAVSSDLQAVEKLYAFYPYFVFCQGELYAFSFKTGLYSNDKTSFLNLIKDHKEYIHTEVYDEKKQIYVKNRRISYGNTISYMEKMIPLMKTMNVNNDWLKQQQSSSLGKLLFKNGYYDFKKGMFYSKEKYGYSPDILFVFCVPHNFEELDDDDVAYMNTIKTRIFYNPLGEELGDYLILNLARGLSGEIMKRFLFCLGGTNGGKSILTDAISLSCGDYAGVFNAENMAYRQSSADEAAQLRWALLLRFKRIIMSNEIKNGDGEKEVCLNSNMMKKCSSGGDAIVGRTHCKEETSFIPHFLTVCFANDMPKIKPYDDAINLRLKIAPFNKTFVTEPSNEFELQLDPDIKDELKTVRFQRCFMMLSLQYYADWNDAKKEEGYVEFEPESVKVGKKDWVQESEGFLVTFFKDFELSQDEKDFVKSSDIEEWIKQTKIGISMTKFAIELKKYLTINKIENVFVKDRKVGGKTSKWWVGIKRLYDADEGVEEEAC